MFRATSLRLLVSGLAGCGGRVAETIAEGDGSDVQTRSPTASDAGSENPGDATPATVDSGPDASSCVMSLDDSFGSAGLVAIDLPPMETGIVLDDGDHHLVVVGGASQPGIGVARLTEDGSVDTSFGDGGLVVPALPRPWLGGWVYVHGALLDPAGRMVVAGAQESSDPQYRWFVARLNPDGTIDSTFGAGGIAAPPPYASNDGMANAIHRLPDGTLIVAGLASNGPSMTMVVVEYDDAGRLKVGFGDGGAAAPPAPAPYSEARCLLPLTDGRILVGGEVATQDGTHAEPAIIRLTPDGTLDSSFGVSGAVVMPLGLGDSPLVSLAPGPGGTFVGAAGGSGDPADSFAVRFTAEAALDPSFGQGGVTSLTLLGNGGDPVSVLPASNGDWFVPGNFVSSPGATETAVAALRPDGFLDPLFGDRGISVAHFSNSASDGLDSAMIDHEGRLVLAGFGIVAADAGGGYRAEFVRYACK